MAQPPVESEQEHDEDDPAPCPEDEEFLHAEAIDGKFLLDLDEEQRKRFTPSELIMYKHAQEYRYIA